MTKEEYLAIRDNRTRDIMPVLRAYHNYAITGRQVALSEIDFLNLMSEWLRNPIIQISFNRIIEQTFKKMDRIYEL